MAARLSALLNQHGEDLFVPLTFGLARRMEQASWQEFVDDSGLTTFAISAARKSLQADGVINWFDAWLEAESAGTSCVRDEEGQVEECSSRVWARRAGEQILANPPVSSALDVAVRLCHQTNESGLVIGYMTGLATLLERIGGGAEEAAWASRIMLALGKAYLEMGVSALLIAEEVEASATLEAAFEQLRPLFNLADYYERPIIFLPRKPPAAEISASISSMGGCIPATGDGRIITLPIGEATPDSCVNEWRRGAGSVRRLVLSTWDVPLRSAPEDVVAIARRIKRR